MRLKRITVSASVVGLLLLRVSTASAQSLLPDQWQSLPPEKIVSIVTDQLKGDNPAEADQARKQVIDHLVQRAQAEPDIASQAGHLPHLIRLAPYIPPEPQVPPAPESPDQRQWLSDTIFQSLDADVVFKPDRLNKDFYYAKRLTAALKTLKADPQQIQDQNPVGMMILAQLDTLPPQFTLTDTTAGKYGYTDIYRRYHRHPAVAQCDAETIRWLRDKLAASPDVHPVAAMILCWRVRDEGPQAFNRWQMFLDAQITRPALTGDQRAGWLLARAYLQEIGGPNSSPLEGQAWIERALAVADSPTVKLDCIRWLALGHAAQNRFEQARNVLKGHPALFATPKTGVLLADWRQQINAAERGQAKVQIIADARAEMQLTRARLEHLQDRIDKARLKGEPTTDIQKMEGIVTGLVSRERELRDGIRNRSLGQAP